jgi:hypothetical protein
MEITFQEFQERSTVGCLVLGLCRISKNSDDVLGSCWVSAKGDETLVVAALAKVNERPHSIAGNSHAKANKCSFSGKTELLDQIEPTGDEPLNKAFGGGFIVIGRPGPPFPIMHHAVGRNFFGLAFATKGEQ